MRSLIVFDIDGTLTQTMDVDSEHFARAIEEVLGLPPIDRDWAAYRHVTDAGVTAELIERHLGRAAENADLDAVRARFVEMLAGDLEVNPHRCRPVPGAPEMLSALEGMGHVACALATGAWRATAELKLRVAGLSVEDLPLASSDDAREREAIMALAIDHAHSRFALPADVDVVYVGDAVWDVEATRAMDLRFIGIGAGSGAERLRAAGADVILEDFTDLPAFLALACAAPPEPK